MNEVGDNYFHELLGELGDLGWACDGCLRGTSTELLDFGFGSVPKLVDEEFICYRDVNTARL